MLGDLLQVGFFLLRVILCGNDDFVVCVGDAILIVCLGFA